MFGLLIGQNETFEGVTFELHLYVTVIYRINVLILDQSKIISRLIHNENNQCS